ncbi:MAG: pyridoxamine 5'-phosphate oxidase family protein [Actinobacteria bacterium]|nr:MAG: pyridoxamine 5'-phosphate oxidase family protein [Actinomycetota bacterium]
MSWQRLAEEAPDIAELARSEFARAGMALIGTLRRDGSPRISCVYPCLFDDALLLGMMWNSRKAIDLLRDPRLVLHNAISSNRGDEVEVVLRGTAIEVQDGETRSAYLAAVPEWSDRRFHLFAMKLAAAAVVRYEAGEQYVKVWPRGVEFRRRY